MQYWQSVSLKTMNILWKCTIDTDSHSKEKFTQWLTSTKSTKHEDFYSCPPTQYVSVYVLCIPQVAHYVWNKTDFDAVDPETTDYLMGKWVL